MNDQLRIVTIRIAHVEDGGVRAWSDDLAGLSITYPNHEILALQDSKRSRATRLSQQDHPGNPSVCGRGKLDSGLGACPNSRCSILSESDSTVGYEQVFSPLEYRSDTAAAAECAGLRAERPCLAVYR